MMDETLVDRKVGNDETNEQLDEEGNAIRVGNLEFLEGILGTGAYGTVRLARRRRKNSVLPQQQQQQHDDGSSGGGCCTSPEALFLSSPEAKNKRPRGHRAARFAKSSKSASMPLANTPDFFRPDDGAGSSISSGSSHNNNHNHTEQQDNEQQHPGPLELIVPRIVRKASSTLGSFRNDDHNNNNNHKKETIEAPELVAVKIYRKSILKRMRTMERDSKTHRVQVKTAFEKVEREIAIMKQLRHPNLVSLYEVIDSPESDLLYMVLEYVELGEILTYQNNGTFVRRRSGQRNTIVEGGVLPNGHFDEAHAALYFVDILHALAYLHQHHICHRDLKPENILLDARGVVKISDFGVSHFFEEEHGIGAHRRVGLDNAEKEGTADAAAAASAEITFKRTNHLTRMDTDSALFMSGMANAGRLTKTEGTWAFWSPEMCGAGSSAFSGYAADMWAAGVCLYIFVTGKLPFYSDIPTDLFEAIAEAEVTYRGLGLSNTLIDLLKATLEKDPSKRAGVGDCLKHPFLQVARSKRIRQLSAELERSGRRKLVVGEEDIRRAFRIVTTIPNPAVLLKSAQKSLKESFQAARERLSMSSQYSSQSSLGNIDESSSRPARKTPGSRRSSLHSQNSSPPTSDNEKGTPRRPLLSTNRHSTMSLDSDSSSNDEANLQNKELFPIPQDRKITESTRDVASLLHASEHSGMDEEDSERNPPSAKAARVAPKSPSKSPARSSKNGWKRHKKKPGTCAIQ